MSQFTRHIITMASTSSTSLSFTNNIGIDINQNDDHLRTNEFESRSNLDSYYPQQELFPVGHFGQKLADETAEVENEDDLSAVFDLCQDIENHPTGEADINHLVLAVHPLATEKLTVAPPSFTTNNSDIDSNLEELFPGHFGQNLADVAAKVSNDGDPSFVFNLLQDIENRTTGNEADVNHHSNAAFCSFLDDDAIPDQFDLFSDEDFIPHPIVDEFRPNVLNDDEKSAVTKSQAAWNKRVHELEVGAVLMISQSYVCSCCVL